MTPPCVSDIPVVSASILGFDGQLSVFKPHDGPCYRCLYPVPPPAELAPSCGANGVLGVLPGTMGLLQATEVVKLITGAGELARRPAAALRSARRDTFTELKVRRDPECPICSIDPSEITDSEMGVFPDYEAFCAAAGRLGPTRRWPRSRFPRCSGRRSAAKRRSRAGGGDRPPSCALFAEQHPATQSQLFGADGSLNRYVNVYLNDEDVRVLDGLDTSSASPTRVILPAMAGGGASAPLARYLRGRGYARANAAAAECRRDPRRGDQGRPARIGRP